MRKIARVSASVCSPQRNTPQSFGDAHHTKDEPVMVNRPGVESRKGSYAVSIMRSEGPRTWRDATADLAPVFRWLAGDCGGAPVRSGHTGGPRHERPHALAL